MGNNITYLAWHTHLSYGIDKILLYTSETLQQSYPFSFHCYYTIDEAGTIATADDFMNQELDQLALDTVYEMRSHTDAGRRVMKMVTEVYPERLLSGRTGFMRKDWYVIGLNLGIIFNNIATTGKHPEL